jgi:pimeloyl-ACP methyl ester carboxylesterase
LGAGAFVNPWECSSKKSEKSQSDRAALVAARARGGSFGKMGEMHSETGHARTRTADWVNDAAAREQTEHLSKVLDRIGCPVHVVHGTADRLVPVKNVEYIQKAMTNAAGIEVTVIEGEGHALPTRRSTAVREAIADVAGRMVAP